MSAPQSCHLCNGHKAGRARWAPPRWCAVVAAAIVLSPLPQRPSPRPGSRPAPFQGGPGHSWRQPGFLLFSFPFILFFYFLGSDKCWEAGLAGESRIAPGRAGDLPSTCRSPFRGLGTQSKGQRRTADPRASRLASALLAAAGAAEPAGSAAGPGHPFILPSRTVAPREAPGPRGRDPVDRAAGGASCTPAPNAASPERGASGFFFFFKEKATLMLSV